MKGIYITSGIDISDKSSGICRKIHKQMEVFSSNGIQMDFISIPKGKKIVDLLALLFPVKRKLYEKFDNEIFFENNLNDYSIVYIRKSTLTLSTVRLCQYIKKHKPNMIILYEIPTYPFSGEYVGKKKLLIPYASFVKKSLKHWIDYIITFSNDKIIWGIPTIRASNCVDFDVMKPKKICENNGTINMIAVASMDFWHGYDRLLKGLVEYYKNGGKRDIHLFLVGYSSLVESYKEIVKKGNIQDKVTFCGKLFGDDLDNIYDKCELGIDALGRHRSNVRYNSSLKGKEYGAKGLPIVSGVETELDSFNDYQYYFRVPSDESDVDIEKVIKFYDKVYKQEKEEIVKNIVNFTSLHFSYQAFFNTIMDKIIQNN